MVEISIIIRTHNEEKWIGQCLRKIREQTLDDLKIVLVDNLSTDKTVEKAQHTYPDLTLVEIDDYMPGLALNEGVRASEGSFFVCLSAHCIPADDGWLEALRTAFDEADDVAGVYGRQLPAESTDPVDKRDLIRTFGPERRVQERDTFFHNANSMIRREVWEDHPFKEEVTNIEDQIWGNEVINAGYRLVYEPDAAVYHHHGINQGNDKKRTRSVVRTMEKNPIHPDDTLDGNLHGNPYDPHELDIVSIIPVRQQINSGVDFDESLILQTIETAIGSEFVDEVVVSTDIDHVAEKATEWGAEAPFLRPPELSETDISVDEVLEYSLEQLESGGWYPDIVVPLEITHPFRPDGLLDNLVEELVTNSYDTVIASFPEYRPCWIRDDDYEASYTRINEETQFRKDREAVQIGLPSLGCATYPHQIRSGRRVGDDIGVYEVENPIATVEIRQRDDLKYWETLREIDGLFE